MQSFIVVASLVSELAGGQNDPPLSPQRYKKHLSPLRVKLCYIFIFGRAYYIQ